MLKVRQDDTGYWQGFKMTFKNGYTISVQFGEGNYCLNYLIPIEEKRQKDIGQCKNCETAILKPNGKFYQKTIYFKKMAETGLFFEYLLSNLRENNP